MKNNNILKAFSLVELIVVISILSILGVISFLWLQDYTAYANQTVKVTNLNVVKKSLDIFEVKTGYYPKPEKSVIVTASGALFLNQGVMGEKLFRILKISKKISGDTEYNYTVSKIGSDFQLVTYLNKNDTSVMYFIGNTLGIISNNGSKINALGNDIDIINNNNKEYYIDFSQGDWIESNSGSVLFKNIYEKNSNLERNENLKNIYEKITQ